MRKSERIALRIRGEKLNQLVSALRNIVNNDDLTIEQAKQIATETLDKTYGRSSPAEVKKMNKKLRSRKTNTTGKKSKKSGSIFLRGVGETRKPGSHRNQA